MKRKQNLVWLIAIMMLFTSSGCHPEILEELFPFHGSNPSGDEITIPISELPQAVHGYVDTNYPDNTIAKAEKKLEDGKWIYRVTLDNEDRLFFDLDGNFLYAKPKNDDDDDDDGNDDDGDDDDGDDDGDDNDGNDENEQEVDIDISDLPELVLDYIDQHYPNTTIEKADKKFEDGRWMYRVRLANDLDVFFDLDGNFLFEKD